MFDFYLLPFERLKFFKYPFLKNMITHLENILFKRMRYTYIFLSKYVCRLQPFSYCRFLCAFTLSKCFRNKCKKYFTYRSLYQLAEVFTGRCSIKTLKICLSAILIKLNSMAGISLSIFQKLSKRLFYRTLANRCFLIWLYCLVGKGFFYLLERLSKKLKSVFADVSH